MAEQKVLVVEDARIIFRNFSGKEGPYNKEGERSFALVLRPDVAERLLADDWNVKFLEPREEGDEPTPYVHVAVRFDVRPPRIIMLTETSRTALDEKSCGVLDWADIKTVDVKLNGSNWAVNDKTGVKAYLQSIYVTIEEDELDKKYAINDNPPQGYED